MSTSNRCLGLIFLGIAVVAAVAIILCRRVGDDLACGFDFRDGEPIFL